MEEAKNQAEVLLQQSPAEMLEHLAFMELLFSPLTEHASIDFSSFKKNDIEKKAKSLVGYPSQSIAGRFGKNDRRTGQLSMEWPWGADGKA